jgi:acetyltransferase-like isoleucine patch superfamily enzyme
MYKLQKFLIFLWFKYIKRIRHIGKHVTFGFRIDIDAPKVLTIADNVIISNDIWIHGEGEKDIIKVTIGKNSELGRRCVISAAKQVAIGNNVIFGPNVFISDHLHAYENIAIPIIKQGINKILPVSIGDGSWLGINSVILPGVTIGKNCVIGANSVVNKSIPDHTVAAGIPAKVIKQYDPKKKKWVNGKKT